MLNKISDEALETFFEGKTNLKTAQLTRSFGAATIILEDCNKNPYVTFQVTDKTCRALPKERLYNMDEIWREFLAEQKEVQKREYYASKSSDENLGINN